MLGVAFEKESLRTADFDVAHDASIPLGVIESPAAGMLSRLRTEDPAFFEVPGLDPREPSTSFKVRGRDLRVDFLTSASKRTRAMKPVYLRHLGVAAQPLYGLDYVIESSVDAAVIVGSGVRVNVPTPARFAFHKLWVSTERPASEAAKARKDIRQAEQLIGLLVEDRPGDLSSAWEALQSRKTLLRGARSALRKIAPSVRSRLADTLKIGA
jgi:hypothetical protein